MYLLDVVKTSRVRFENGCVMEHLIKSNTEEDHVQLENTDKHRHTSKYSAVMNLIKDTMSP